MRRRTFLLFALITLLALPLPAQEKETAKETGPSMAPPKPLDDDLCKWMVGEWEGTTTWLMGKNQDWQKVEWGLDNQWVMIHGTSKMLERTPEQVKAMADAYKMSKEEVEKMGNMVYKGMGPMTINPATGEYVGYWFDSWRGVYKGSGKREGNKITMTWEGTMGTSVRTIEKVSDDKMIQTFVEKDPSGNVMEGRTESTRKKMAAPK